MAYTPKTWVCGEKITADGLNNIEEGIQEALASSGGGGAFYIEATGTMPNLTADKTFAELLQAIDDGCACFIRWDASQGLGQQVMIYSLVQYSRNSSAPDAYFTHADSNSIGTLKMLESGAITSV